MTLTGVLISVAVFIITSLLGIIAYFLHRQLDKFDAVASQVNTIGNNVEIIKLEMMTLEKRQELVEKVVYMPRNGYGK